MLTNLNSDLNVVHELINTLVSRSEHFLHEFCVGNNDSVHSDGTLTGNFALYPGQSSPDLYGMIDSAYILYILGRLDSKTSSASRKLWAERILDCQDQTGWFSKHNLRGHSREHATAYAIGALKLLEFESGERYLERMKPLSALRPITRDYEAFRDWIMHMGFRFSLRGLIQKNLGWHYIWRGSHVGGGVAAILGMIGPMLERWFPDGVTVDQWFSWYFDWLDVEANPRTGYWQRAFWNRITEKPTVIDLGGAAHFLWIYDAYGHSVPHPEKTIMSTMSLQNPDGLYSDHPFCIDLDGNFCLIRPYLQLPQQLRKKYTARVSQAVENNFVGVLESLTEQPLGEIYSDLHGLPGALTALVECAKMPEFKYAETLQNWCNPLDRVWWL